MFGENAVFSFISPRNNKTYRLEFVFLQQGVYNFPEVSPSIIECENDGPFRYWFNASNKFVKMICIRGLISVS